MYQLSIIVVYRVYNYDKQFACPKNGKIFDFLDNKIKSIKL